MSNLIFRPHQAGVSAQQYKDYEDIDISNKKPDIEHISFRPEETLYQNGQKFTPFLDSNALPGPFRYNNILVVLYTYKTSAKNS